MKKGAHRLSRETRVGYYFVLPALVFMACMIVYPMLYNFRLSMMNVDVMTFKDNRAVFVGLENFRQLFQNDPVFLASLKHTFQFTIRCLIIQFTLGFAFALLFTKKFPMGKLIRGLILIAYLMPMAVTGLLFKNMFASSASEGLINAVLTWLRVLKPGQSLGWLLSDQYALWAVTIANCWVGIPFNMLLLVAGLSTIGSDIYEAAMIDGANAMQRFFRITLPMMKQAILSVLMLGFIYTFKVFDLIYIMTNGGPVNATQVLSSYSYKLSFTQYNYSMGAAVAVVLFLCLLCVGLTYLFLVKKEEVQ